MKLTVTAPCFNETKFIRAWLQNCLDFGADRIVVSEGGSTDGTREILNEFQRAHGADRLTILEHPQTPNPMRGGWNETARRQALTEHVREGVEVLLDVDEMLPDDFRDLLDAEWKPGDVALLRWCNFWRSPNYIRVGIEADPCWGPIPKACVFPAGSLAWTGGWNHAETRCDLPGVRLNGIKFHYHYLYGEAKAFENRIVEFTGDRRAADVEISLRPIRVQHPKAFGLLEEHVRFQEMML